MFRFILTYVISQRLVNEKHEQRRSCPGRRIQGLGSDLGKRMEAEHAHSAKHPRSRHPHHWHDRLSGGRSRPSTNDRRRACGQRSCGQRHALLHDPPMK